MPTAGGRHARDWNERAPPRQPGAALKLARVPTLPHTRPRFDRIDALRGVAIVWMTVFHFCFDLNYFGWIRQNFLYDPFWTTQRTCIVSLFLFCAGLGQAVAHAQGQAGRASGAAGRRSPAVRCS